MSEHLCPYCNRLYRVPQGQGHRNSCFKQKCIEANLRDQRERDRATRRIRSAENPLSSLRLKDKEANNHSVKFVECRVCHKMKPGPFDMCRECRERKRNTINTDYMYLADDVQMWGKEV